MVCVVSLFADELPIHGFGVKTQGLAAYGSQLRVGRLAAMATGRAALRPVARPGPQVLRELHGVRSPLAEPVARPMESAEQHARKPHVIR